MFQLKCQGLLDTVIKKKAFVHFSMVSCIRVQQVPVNWISVGPQIDKGKSVLKIYCSNSRNPDKGLIDTQGQIRNLMVFNI